MKKILVPTDLSETAELGLKLALQIAKRCNGTISLINFTRHPLGKTFSSTGEVNLQADAEETLFTLELLQAKKEKLAALAAQYSGDGVPIEFAVIDDKFKSGLDAFMSQDSVDLVVMGTSGEETAREAFIGNHTERVIRISPCPVISVRDGFAIDEFKNIVAAVAVLTDNQAADGLRQLKELSDCFDSHVHLVHVRDHAGESNLILEEYFSKMATIAGLEKFSVTILDAEDVTEAVLTYGEKVNAGMIAVLKNVQDGIFRILSNRISNRVIKEEGKPVFTLNLQNVPQAVE
jgi:nucleotide-binding universal stress UspA family protein